MVLFVTIGYCVLEWTLEAGCFGGSQWICTAWRTNALLTFWRSAETVCHSLEIESFDLGFTHVID